MALEWEVGTERISVLVHEYVTGGGLAGQALPPSLAAEGAAMRRAVATDLAAVPGTILIMTLDERLPVEPGPWQIERVGPGAERVVLATSARACDAVLVIAPETDGVLAERERVVHAEGGRSLGSTPEAISLAADKLAAARWLADRGVPVAAGVRIEPGSAWPENRPPQAVLKPIDGAGSLDTYYLDRDSLWPTPQPDRPWLLQPFLPGDAASISLIIAPAGPTARGWIELVGTTHQHMIHNNGRFHYQGGSIPARLPTRLLAPVVDALRSWDGLRGWVGVDLIIGPARDRATILEVNPRLTTSYVGLRRWVEGSGPALARRLLESAGCVAEGSGPTSRRVVRTRGIAEVVFAAAGECRVRLEGGRE
jgi:predicted ATP-grasp superfamily ATP-dependent carboligase